MHSILLLADIVTVAAVGDIFVILFACIFAALKQGALFGRAATAIVATCVSLLCVVGLFGSFGLGNETSDTAHKNGMLGRNMEIILIPYEALAIAILLTLLFLFLLKVFGGKKLERYLKGTEQRIEKHRLRKKRKEQELTKQRRSDASKKENTDVR